MDRHTEQRFNRIKQVIDGELNMKVLINSGIIRRETEPTLIDDDLIFETSKKILKDVLQNHSTIIRKNKYGFSVTISSEKIEELCNFLNQGNTLLREITDQNTRNELNQFFSNVHRPQIRENHYFSNNRLMNIEEGKVQFYVKYKHHFTSNFYRQSLVYQCVFELIHIVEELERKTEEDLPRFLAVRQEHIERLERQCQEEERRRRLMERGFSNEGVSLGDRLQDILNRRRSE